MNEHKNPLESNYSYYMRTLRQKSSNYLKERVSQWDDANPLTRIFYTLFFINVDVRERAKACRDILKERERDKIAPNYHFQNN